MKLEISESKYLTYATLHVIFDDSDEQKFELSTHLIAVFTTEELLHADKQLWSVSLIASEIKPGSISYTNITAVPDYSS